MLTLPGKGYHMTGSLCSKYSAFLGTRANCMFSQSNHCKEHTIMTKAYKLILIIVRSTGNLQQNLSEVSRHMGNLQQGSHDQHIYFSNLFGTYCTPYER